jgi:hypothetical protein
MPLGALSLWQTGGRGVSLGDNRATIATTITRSKRAWYKSTMLLSLAWYIEPAAENKNQRGYSYVNDRDTTQRDCGDRV